jgi:hypothetical protein
MRDYNQHVRLLPPSLGWLHNQSLLGRRSRHCHGIIIDIQVEPIARISAQGHGHRSLLMYFAENLKDRLLARNVVTRKELDDLLSEVKRHIDNPHTLVLGGLYFQTWGRRPAQQ